MTAIALLLTYRVTYMTYKMIYTCEKCRFTFRRSKEVEACPDCGKQAVREATEKEKEEYRANREKYKKMDKQ